MGEGGTTFVDLCTVWVEVVTTSVICARFVKNYATFLDHFCTVRMISDAHEWVCVRKCHVFKIKLLATYF